ncbi:MAG: response regulator [Myxococcaceae bacterium]|nr:response regulator [Myxococcaceae bacterium]
MTDARDRRHRLEALRERASALLQEDTTSPTVAMDVKQLVHELRVLNTELAMQHDELLASEARAQRQATAWEQLFRGAPVAILTIDGHRRLEQYNDEAALLLNLSPRSVSQPVDWLIDSGSQADWQAMLNAAGSRPLMRELLVRAVGGERVIVRAMVTRRAVEGPGEPGWLLVFLDVSALAAASTRAKEATSRLERLVGAMSDGVLFARWQTGIVEQVNPAMARLLGLDAVAPPALSLSSLFPPARAAVSLLTLEALGRAPGSEPVAMQLVSADGRVVDVEVHAGFLDEAGGPLLSVVARDVSEKVVLARRRAELEAAALRTQQLEAIGQLATGVAHDFNNLLTVVLSCEQGLEPFLPPDEPHLMDLRRAALRGRELTARLLTLARLKLEQKKPMRLSVVCREALALARRSFPASILIETDFATEADEFDADEGQWVQALLNVCINARDAMPDGGVLRLVLATAGDGVTLSVRDSGPGMSPEVQRQAFEPFFTTKGPGAGTGLGLAHVHAVAQAHGVQVSLDSAPGLGTTVRFFVPVTRRPQAASPREAAPVASSLTGVRVLLVDDDERVRRASARVLHRLKCVVVEADGVEGACALLDSGQALDVILTDLSMPMLSGEDLVTRVQQMAHPLPVVVVTGMATDETQRRLSAAGAAAVLPKPYTELELRECLGRVLASAAP